GVNPSTGSPKPRIRFPRVGWFPANPAHPLLSHHQGGDNIRVVGRLTPLQLSFAIYTRDHVGESLGCNVGPALLDIGDAHGTCLRQIAAGSIQPSDLVSSNHLANRGTTGDCIIEP